jgi:hypothetical protein
MVAAGWSEAQKRAYVLADNQLAITGSGWDPELLRLELGELKLGGFDLSLTGFGELELKDLLAERTAGLTDPDDAPPVPEHPVSQTGDLWLLGAKVTCPKCGKATALETAPLGERRRSHQQEPAASGSRDGPHPPLSPRPRGRARPSGSWRAAVAPIASIVVIAEPPMLSIEVMQERVAAPSTCRRRTAPCRSRTSCRSCRARRATPIKAGCRRRHRLSDRRR